MEFPELGKHCSEETCHKLDFLPMKCDGCGRIYCSEHFNYEKHSCPSAYKKDVQVPVCPLCNTPIPTARGVSPDVTVGQHIDQFCRSDKTKIYTNRCTYKNCKKKELIPVSCTECKQNFCLRHRHTADHDCQGPINQQRQLLAKVAVQRQQAPNPNLIQTVQGGMSEDEAFARALALSLEEERPGTSQQNQNQNERVAVGGSNSKDKCNLS